MRRNVALRRKIRGALAYPAFLLFASACMVTFLTLYVVPRMSSLFEGFNKQLPTITVLVLGLYFPRHRRRFGPARRCVEAA